MKVLIVDTETSGLEPDKHSVIEVAAIHYSITHQSILGIASTLLPVSRTDNPAESTNQIKIEACHAVDKKLAALNCQTIRAMAEDSKYILAHNSGFDKGFLQGHGHLGELAAMRWLCTCSEFKWPKYQKPGKLIDIALAHGIGVSSAHRAMVDCWLIAELLNRVDDPLALIEHALLPRNTYRSLQPFKQNELAKERGFRFHGDTKTWRQKLTDDEYNLIAKEDLFKMELVEV